MLLLILPIFSLLQLTQQFQSISVISDYGYTFTPFDNSAKPFRSSVQSKLLRCYSECNKYIQCRTFDFDENSGQCQLWSEDTTTGSISFVTLSQPRSKVAFIKLSPSTYATTHNQTCDKCANSRYEICDTNTMTCQCPTMTFWNGSMCLPQRYENQTCLTIDTCRSDRNLECIDTHCDSIYRCKNITYIGVTIAGFCNATVGGGSQGLSGPWCLHITPDSTLYVADYDAYRLQAYSTLSRAGTTIPTPNTYLEDVFVDNKSNVYMAVMGIGFIHLWPSNISFPKNISYPCTPFTVYAPYGVAVDNQDNIYVSDYWCHTVTKWSGNFTAGTVVAGQMNTAGSTNLLLNSPKCIFYEETHSKLYVVDYGNDRVQKFTIGGNRIGITVAGGNGRGSGLNQLKTPTGVWVSKKDETVYVGDTGNHRVMKWMVNATQGTLLAGVTGVPGNSSQQFNVPGDVALDPTETFIYIADYGNHRVQRFRL